MFSIRRVGLILVEYFRQRGFLYSIRQTIQSYRHNGFVFTINKIKEKLFFLNENDLLCSTNKWLGKYGIHEKSTIGKTLFSRTTVVIIGALDLPQCKKYRVCQKIELFGNLDIGCNISDYRDIPRCFRLLQLATHVIFYRVPYNSNYKAFLNECRRLGIYTFYDIDDPVFDKKVYLANTNIEFLEEKEKKQLLVNSELYFRAIQQVDKVFVSTPELKKLIEYNIKKPAIIWRNLVDSTGESNAVRLNYARKLECNEKEVVLGYFSGSRAHEADFRVIELALLKTLEQYKSSKLIISGYLELPSSLEMLRNRIEKIEFSGYDSYYSVLSRVDINLVPLHNNKFNECKSAIRYMEAAIMKVPTIASKIGDYKNLIIDKENGMFAIDTDEWIYNLSWLIEDQKKRTELGENAYLSIKDKYLVKSCYLVNNNLIKYFT